MIDRARNGEDPSPLAGIRLVVLDLDGTLLPETKVLTARARRVVGELRAAGCEVTLATGKGWTHTERYAVELQLEAPLVALEGAFVARAGHELGGEVPPLRSLSLDAMTMRRIRRAVEDLDVAFFFTRDGHRIVADRALSARVDQLRVWDPSVTFVSEPMDDPGLGRPHLLHLIGDAEPVTTAARRVEHARIPGIELLHAPFWDGLHQLMLLPVGVGKHHALGAVLAELRIGPGEVLACGDWWNDVGMLAMAGVAVAPANAVEGVRQVADHVLSATCETDAVVRFLDDALQTL